MHAPSWLASHKFRDYVQQCSNDECEHRFPTIQMRCEESKEANVSGCLAKRNRLKTCSTTTSTCVPVKPMPTMTSNVGTALGRTRASCF